MEFSRRAFLACAAVLALAGCRSPETADTGSSSKPAGVKQTVVGVYDSRAIAYAYWLENVDGKPRFAHPESTKGMSAEEGSIMMHQQVFSYHKPVQALAYIADKVPEVMKKAGVDVIVSKWDKEELAKYRVSGSGWDEGFGVNNPNVVDVTIELTQIFNPKATRNEYEEGLGRSKPEPLDTDWRNAKE